MREEVAHEGPRVAAEPPVVAAVAALLLGLVELELGVGVPDRGDGPLAGPLESDALHVASGVRVGIDIKFCGGGDVAACPDRTAHDDKFFHGIDEAWFLANGERNIGQGADGKDRDLIWFSQYSFDQIINGMLLNGIGIGFS